MNNRIYYIVNGITAYRLITAPLLLLLIFNKVPDLFKWLLAVSFLTDAVDGFLARKYHVTSIAGSRLDSIADDLTVFVALVGMIVFKPEFIRQEILLLLLLLLLFIIQTGLAIRKYGKITSFHTYAAKVATILQAIFMVLFFLLPDPIYILFYSTILITGMELVEEIIIMFWLPQWEANVKGLYWIIKRKKKT